MSPQEVISELNRLKSGAPCSDVDRRDKAIEVAKNVITRTMISQKVIYETDDGREYEDMICPTCKRTIAQRRKGAITTPGYLRCDYCGQALDWSDDE